MKPAQFCQDKGAAVGSGFYYACLYQEQASRQLLYPILALYNELLELIYRHTDPGVARTRLSWWAEELQGLQQGEARHPITRQLHSLHCERLIDHAELLACLVNTEQHFLQFNTVSDSHHWLQRHKRHVRGIAWYQAKACQVEEAEYVEAICHVMSCVSALEELHHLPRIFAAGRNPLPTMLLQQQQIDIQLLCEQADKDSSHLLFKQLLQQLLSKLLANKETLTQSRDKRLNFSRILNAIVIAQTRAYLAADKNILQQHICLSPVRKLMLAWRNKH